MKLFCIVCNGKLIAVSREQTNCSNGCEFNGNVQELKELGLVSVFNKEAGSFMEWDRYLRYQNL